MTERLMSKHGFQIIGTTFAEHLHSCDRCRQYDETKPATATQCCLDGSILLKAAAHREAPKRPSPVRSGYYATKAQVKAAMKYK